MIERALLYESSMVWASDFPRQATRGQGAKQRPVSNRPQLIDCMMNAAEANGPGFCSVYSFPDGHSKDGHIPKIDTVFFDLDIPADAGEYNPREGGDLDGWKRDVSKLLVRARMMAQSILDEDMEDHFRIALSGHKGIHLYVDFPALDYDLGPLKRYKNGLHNYSMEMIDFFSESAGVDLHKWVDVTSHDLGRLSRLPNTPHTGAKHVEHTPFCVPVSVEELSQMDAETYLAYTRQPRQLPSPSRTPSENARDVITQNVLNASDTLVAKSDVTGSTRNQNRLDEYQEQSNDKMTVDAVKRFVIAGKPCIEAWVNRDDAYGHGSESRTMEINIIKELSKHDVPIDVIIEFFSEIPGFNEAYTEGLVKDIIARYWPSAFVCSNITQNAPTFCLKNKCHIYERSDDLTIE